MRKFKSILIKIIKIVKPVLILVSGVGVILVYRPDFWVIQVILGGWVFLGLAMLAEQVIDLLSWSEYKSDVTITVTFNRHNDRGILGVNERGVICMLIHGCNVKPDYGSVWECVVLKDNDRYLFVDPVRQVG